MRYVSLTPFLLGGGEGGRVGGGGGRAKKCLSGRLPPEVQPRTLLYTISHNKGTPFVYLQLTNGTPFTYLV